MTNDGWLVETPHVVVADRLCGGVIPGFRSTTWFQPNPSWPGTRSRSAADNGSSWWLRHALGHEHPTLIALAALAPR